MHTHSMQRVLLDTGLDGRRVAWLRMPTGADELAAEDGVDAMLDRCLVSRGESCVDPGSACRLPVADRDRLLLALERMLFGDEVEADAPCTRCGEPFSVRFSLAALADARQAHRPVGVEGPDPQGHYRLAGVTFRLPCAADLEHVRALAPDAAAGRELLQRLVLDGDAAGREEPLEEAMAALGPTLDVDLEAACPHCAAGQSPRFSLATFLGRQLAAERRFVLREVHSLARAYGWSFDSIAALTRGDRHALVALVEGEGAGAGAPLPQMGLAT